MKLLNSFQIKYLHLNEIKNNNMPKKRSFISNFSFFSLRSYGGMLCAHTAHSRSFTKCKQ